MEKILILSTPRTGSNLLCECLSQTGLIGHVDGFMVGFGEGIKHDYAKTVHMFYQGHCGEDGSFATKIMWDYIDHMADLVTYKTVYEVFFSQFSHVVWVYRDDIIAQAVSWYMAINSGKWTSLNEQKRPYPDYHFDYIAWFVAKIKSYNERTQYFVQSSGLEYRARISYESIASDTEGALRAILNTDKSFSLKPTLKRQEHPLKAEFIGRFKEDIQCLPVLPNYLG